MKINSTKENAVLQTEAIQTVLLQTIMQRGTIIIPAMLGTIPAGNTGGAINTGRRNTAVMLKETNSIMEIIVTTIINIGKEIGKVTGGTIIAG